MIASLASFLITLLIFAIFGRVILDWLVYGGVMRSDSSLRPLRNALVLITEPVLSPIRRFARIGTIDLSPMAAIIILSLVQQLVGR